jgi:hypothetical protein
MRETPRIFQWKGCCSVLTRIRKMRYRSCRSKGLDYGQYGPYDCPIYKYPKRNDRYLIFRMLLKTEQHPFHWKIRGVSLMAQTE